MLELAVLGLLKEKPMYGYELKKRLDERLGHAWKFSYGSLYPTLKRLLKAEAVEMENVTGTSSRRKNVYRIALAGEQLFDRLLEESGPTAAEDRDTFMLRFSFFRYTKPETRRRLLERRRGYLLDRLAKIKDSFRRLQETMDNYSLELMRHGTTEVEHDIQWLDQLLEAETKGQRKSARRTTRPRARRRPVTPAEPVAAPTERPVEQPVRP